MALNNAHQLLVCLECKVHISEAGTHYEKFVFKSVCILSCAFTGSLELASPISVLGKVERITKLRTVLMCIVSPQRILKDCTACAKTQRPILLADAIEVNILFAISPVTFCKKIYYQEVAFLRESKKTLFWSEVHYFNECGRISKILYLAIHTLEIDWVPYVIK